MVTETPYKYLLPCSHFSVDLKRFFSFL
jgi:hypothetical protein